MALTLLVRGRLLLLTRHHGWMSHLRHHSLPLLGRHPLGRPLLLLLRVLEWSAHPLLLKLHLRGVWDLWQVPLLGGLLYVPPSADHHPGRSALLLIHVGSSGRHGGRSL